MESTAPLQNVHTSLQKCLQTVLQYELCCVKTGLTIFVFFYTKRRLGWQQPGQAPSWYTVFYSVLLTDDILQSVSYQKKAWCCRQPTHLFHLTMTKIFRPVLAWHSLTEVPADSTNILQYITLSDVDSGNRSNQEMYNRFWIGLQNLHTLYNTKVHQIGNGKLQTMACSKNHIELEGGRIFFPWLDFSQ